MAQLKSMEKIVYEVLNFSPLARKDDYVLMWLVCEKLTPDLCNKPFGDVMYNHKDFKLPNWETVTRCRRKLQEKHPELRNPKTATYREVERRDYVAYSRE